MEAPASSAPASSETEQPSWKKQQSSNQRKRSFHHDGEEAEWEQKQPDERKQYQSQDSQWPAKH
jgi:hypothetical protein